MRTALPLIGAILSLSLHAHATGSLLLCEWSGDLYEVSSGNAAKTFIGDTGLTNLGALETALDGTVYGIVYSNPGSALYSISVSDASATFVANLNIPFPIEGGLAFSPAGIAYATGNSGFGTTDLLTINVLNGQVQTVGNLGPHELNGLMWRSDGMLVGLDWQANALVEVNPANAAASVIATLSFPVGVTGGMAGDAAGTGGWFATGRPAFGSGGTDTLYSFDAYTGQTTSIGALNLADFGAGGLAFKPVPAPAAWGLPAAILLLRGRHRRISL